MYHVQVLITKQKKHFPTWQQGKIPFELHLYQIAKLGMDTSELIQTSKQYN